MSKVKYTQGPYKISDATSQNIFGDAISVEIVDANGFQVAELPFTAIMPDYMEKLGINHWAQAPGKAFIERDPNEVLATAHLFKAAPDMYKALSALVELREKMFNNQDDQIDELSVIAGTLLWNDVKTALAKAEGRDISPTPGA